MPYPKRKHFEKSWVFPKLSFSCIYNIFIAKLTHFTCLNHPIVVQGVLYSKNETFWKKNWVLPKFLFSCIYNIHYAKLTHFIFKPCYCSAGGALTQKGSIFGNSLLGYILTLSIQYFMSSFRFIGLITEIFKKFISRKYWGDFFCDLAPVCMGKSND